MWHTHTPAYCTISTNSSVTGHSNPRREDLGNLSQVTMAIKEMDRIFWCPWRINYWLLKNLLKRCPGCHTSSQGTKEMPISSWQSQVVPVTRGEESRLNRHPSIWLFLPRVDFHWVSGAVPYAIGLNYTRCHVPRTNII